MIKKMKMQSCTQSVKTIFGLFYIIRLGFLLLLCSSSSAFTALNDNSATLESYIGTGKWTVIEVWESSCEECRSHMPDMVKLDNKYDNMQVVGVNLDQGGENEGVKAWVDDLMIKFPILLSTRAEMNTWMQKKVGQGILAMPTFIVFDPEGQVAATQPGIISMEAIESYVKGKEEVEDESDCADDL